MQHLRLQVDRIDLKILKLLQQRTKLSTRIGETKRRHRAVIYVPERERELLARVSRLSNGTLPPRAIASIYREILSSSRAAQGQAPIGLLGSSATMVIPSARWCFGGCDEFVSKKTWMELAAGLDTASLALALLTSDDLIRILQKSQARSDFLARFAISGDFSPALETKISFDQRVFITTLRNEGAAGTGNRLLILIKCKSRINALKSLSRSMLDDPIFIENVTLSAPSARGETALLVRVTLSRLIDWTWAKSQLIAAGRAADFDVSLLGVYPGPENGG